MNGDSMMRQRVSPLLVVAVFLASSLVWARQREARTPAAAKSYTNWAQYGGGADSAQYTPLALISRANVADLEVAWTYPTGGNSAFSPIIVDGVMYTAIQDAVVALDAATGAEIWVHPTQGALGGRGFNYWESGDRSDRRLLYMNAGFLTAIDVRTGATIASFGDKGRVDVRTGADRDIATLRGQTSNPGRIFRDIFIIPLPASGSTYRSAPADIHAFNVVTGKLEWVFHTVPRQGEFGADTWPAESLATAGGVHNWSEMTIDETRGIAFIPTGTARYDFYGANRHGANLFGNSLLALDARTGKRLWHYQIIHHDLWDYDLAPAPKLLTITRNGRAVDVVAQATKHGFLFVFNRETGEPIWPIEERPVPPSDVPGEQAWPTQPFPTAPPPFARQVFAVKDINPLLPAGDQARLRMLFQTYRNDGLFTPPSLRGSVQIPGNSGGANWGSVAVNPSAGTLFVVSKELPALLKLIPQDAGRGDAPGTLGPYLAPYDFMLMTDRMSAIGPPWSQLTAYDLNTGTIKWQIPNGNAAGLPQGTGAQGTRGSPLVTGGGLVFVGTPSDQKLRAYNTDTGTVLWEKGVFGSPGGLPASYEIGGRQYIAFTVADGAGVGGMFAIQGRSRPTPGPLQLRVYALPR
jgi:quinoprotein glucose dehydrogenase